MSEDRTKHDHSGHATGGYRVGDPHRLRVVGGKHVVGNKIPDDVKAKALKPPKK